MIVEPFVIYEGLVGISTSVALVFILRSRQIVVLHRRFLLLLTIGIGVMSVGLVTLSPRWPRIVQVTHLVYISCLTIGLYLLIKETQLHTSEIQ